MISTPHPLSSGKNGAAARSRICVLLFVAAAAASVAPARAQMLTPDDDRDRTRFQAAVLAAGRAGFGSPVVVGRGRDAQDKFFCLLGTQGGKGVLLTLLEPGPGASATPLVLETGANPPDLGIGDIRFGAFLGEPDLVDVAVGHRPFQLEMSRTYDRHYILRRSGDRLALAGEFDGSASSSYAKGYRSVTQTVTVSTVKVTGESPLAFDLHRVQLQTEKGGSGTSPSVERQEDVVRYRLDASGRFMPEKK
jgi:hypothetical protein